MRELVVIILTLDEAVNIRKAVASVGDRAPVVVVDSGSTDDTRALAEAAGAEVHEHAFVDYASQRNFALDLVRDRFRWVFFLDADEEIPPALWDDIERTIERDEVDGAYVGLTFHVLGRELRHGPFAGASILRLMRADMARFTRGTNERVDDSAMRVTTLGKLKHDDAKPLASWFRKHVRYAEREARLYLEQREAGGSLEGASLRTKRGRMVAARWAYDRMPLLVRPFIHLGRAVVMQSGWRDGLPGLLYAGMQSFWYPMLIDLLVIEEKWLRSGGRPDDE